MPKPVSQSTQHIMMTEPLGFLSNPQTMETNTYQEENATDLRSIQDHARAEFRLFRDRLVEAGVVVTTVLGHPDSPDDVFCNNWISTQKDRSGEDSLVYYPMLASNRRIERRPEVMAMLEGRYPVALDLSKEELNGRYLESTGSLWMDRVNRVAYCAISPRTNEDLAREWCARMDFEFLPFHTRNHTGKPVYHTDVMMFIGTGYAGVCLECILPEDREKVVARLSLTHEIIPISLAQLKSFCGNSLELVGSGGALKLIMSGAAYRALTEAQKKALLRYVSEIVWADIPTIEKYGGGSARCMLLELH
jgi:hypothetical protein